MKTKPKPKNRLRAMKDICSRINLAGVQYSDYQKAKGLQAGVPLTARWEPRNRFDDRAIAVYYGETRIGYIPRMTNEDVQDLMHDYREEGIKLHLECTAYNKTNPSWSMITVAIRAETLLGDEDTEQAQEF